MVDKVGKLLFVKVQSKMVQHSSAEIANFQVFITPNRHRATSPNFANALTRASTTVWQCRYVPGWKVCQLRTECQETDKILRTKNEINVRPKIKIEIARDGPIPIFYDNVL